MKKKTNRTYIGGQAVIQGVMMRGKEGMATVVRDDNGALQTEALRIEKKRRTAAKIPFVRGVVNFVSSLVLGMKALMRSSEVILSEEEEEPSKLSKWLADHWKVSLGGIVSVISTVLGVLIAVGLFMFLPQYLAGLIADHTFGGGTTTIWYNLIEGGFRLVIFILYILFTLCFKSLRETYQYHGAEHKTINCFEYGEPLTVENVKKCSRLHDRCGTTFIFIVLVISILIFSLVNWLLAPLILTNIKVLDGLIRMVLKLALLPVVAGVSYEVLKLLSCSQSPVLLPFKAPGFLLQMLTTREPEEDMIECAIQAFERAYALDTDPEAPEKFFATETKLSELLKLMKDRFAKKGIDESDAEWIAALSLGIPRSTLSEDRIVYRNECKKIIEIFEERLTGRPLWYILGDTDFCGYTLKVDERVLIPRPETELLVEQAVSYLREGDSMLDLCTGSGAIAVAVACETAKDRTVSVTASDISEEALELARENARINKANVTFVRSDLFDGVRGRFNLITANPPYVPRGEIETLSREVKDFEPRLALDGGEDGLDFYRRIAKKAGRHIARGGMLMLECGENQAQDIIKIFQSETRCEFAMVVKDFADVERVVKIGF